MIRKGYAPVSASSSARSVSIWSNHPVELRVPTVKSREHFHRSTPLFFSEVPRPQGPTGALPNACLFLLEPLRRQAIRRGRAPSTTC